MSEKESASMSSGHKTSSESNNYQDVELNVKEGTGELQLTDEEKKQKVDQLASEMNISQKKLMWKIDLCVVPPFCLLYFLAFLDRVNVSNAKVYGIEKALGLHGNQFATALTVFFVPYIVFEVLSNYLIKIIKPHVWLSVMIFLFGLVTLLVAWSKNFGGLVVCRLFLGIFEAGSFPAIFYIIANFYTSGESLKRIAFFFNCTCLAGGCAGALAYRINDLHGVHGFDSWQWIYIIEGAFTMGLAIPLYFAVSDFPEEARFLNENERSFLKQKLELYQGNSGFEIKQTWKDIATVFKEPMLYITAICYFSLVVPSYCYAFFAPTVIAELGYTAMEAQRHSIYPWLATMGFSIILAVTSDMSKIRLPFALIASAVSIAGLSIVFSCYDANARYAGCFLTAMGLYSCMPILICWMSLNFSGHTRKSVGTAFVIGFGNIGGIVSSFIFPNNEAPRFKKGFGICIAFACLAFLLLAVYAAYLRWLNFRKDTDSYRQQWNEKDERSQIVRGDLNPDFKY
ncbi:MFS transporter [Lacticaseibacillus paracasei]|nr:MFS transporter [Lacticaseibacillus paracasei]